jgi:general secretion pathway protein A
LRAWGAEGLREEERQAERLDLSQIARARHLEYLPLSGNLNLLTLLDLPVIVELLAPEQKELRFVLMLKISGDRCWVLMDEEQEVPLRVISDNWFGKAHLFWRNFEGLEAYLTVGSVGQSVKRLHTLLHRAEVYPEPPSATFDTKTEEAVALFQGAKRLVADGVVGPLTMIMLYNSLPGYPHPRLMAGMEDPNLQGEEA